jgi:phosphinothricin acetyltransferase
MPDPSIAPASAEDLEGINTIYNHYVITSSVTFDLEPRSMQWREEWFSKFDRTGPYRLLVAHWAGVVAGYASSSQYRPRAAYDTSVETSIYLAPDHTGRGLGKELYDALFGELEGQGLHRAYAGTTLPNPASVRLHERCGFQRVGYYSQQGFKFGQFWDVAWYERAIS